MNEKNFKAVRLMILVPITLLGMDHLLCNKKFTKCIY